MKKNVVKIMRNLAKTYSKAELLELVNTLYPDTKPKSLEKRYIGCYAFENNLFSDKPNTFPNLLGVVVHLDPDAPQHGTIMLKEEAVLTYEQAEKYCAEFQTPTIPQGSGFLASKELWRKIFVQNQSINFSLKKANCKLLTGDYWAESPNHLRTAIVITSRNGRDGYASLLSTWKVRCFIKF